MLAEARELDDGSGLVFPSPLRPGHELSWQALLKVLRTNTPPLNASLRSCICLMYRIGFWALRVNVG